MKRKIPVSIGLIGFVVVMLLIWFLKWPRIIRVNIASEGSCTTPEYFMLTDGNRRREILVKSRSTYQQQVVFITSVGDYSVELYNREGDFLCAHEGWLLGNTTLQVEIYDSCFALSYETDKVYPIYLIENIDLYNPLNWKYLLDP